MKGFLRVSAWFLLLSSLGAAGWWAWPLVFPPERPGLLSRLAKADSALQQGRADLARKALEPWPEGLSAGQWLQWEKRIHSIVVKTKEWGWAASAAHLATAQFPGNTELAAFETWVLLKAGRAGEALGVSEKLLAKTVWAPLLGQARLEAGLFAAKPGEPRDSSSDWLALRQALATSEAADPELYGRVLELAPDDLLRKNALLVALAQGRLDLAQGFLGALSPSERGVPPFDKLQALMAYDQEDWARSAALLRNLAVSDPTTHQVLADVYLHLGELEQARLIYDQVLADSSPSEILPPSLYLNRATIALIQSDPGLALALLNRALVTRSSESGTPLNAIRLLLLEARRDLGEESEVRAQLDKVLGDGQETPFQLEAELLKYRLFPEMESVPRLWSLMHRHPDTPPLVERLVWSQLIVKDYPAAQKALDLYRQKSKPVTELPWWWSSYQGLLLALDGDLQGAEKTWEEVPAAWRDTSFHANLAQVQTSLSRRAPEDQRQVLLERALDNDTKALDLLPTGNGRQDLILRSQLLAHRGTVSWSLVAFQKPSLRQRWKDLALDDLRKASQLDANNLRAAFLLRQSASALQEVP
ncbi:MAG: hypothetical protein WCG80_00855 [Spirochaetales bacterium]